MTECIVCGEKGPVRINTGIVVLEDGEFLEFPHSVGDYCETCFKETEYAQAVQALIDDQNQACPLCGK